MHRYQQVKACPEYKLLWKTFVFHLQCRKVAGHFLTPFLVENDEKKRGYERKNIQLAKSYLNRIFLGIHGYPANHLLSGQIVAFFTICICICTRPEVFLLSVSGQQNANRYRYKKKLKLLMYNSSR